MKINSPQDQEIAEMAGRQLSLNNYGDACDGLLKALCYAKTWCPPADMPAGYVPHAEFARRARELAGIAEKWSAEATKTEEPAK